MPVERRPKRWDHPFDPAMTESTVRELVTADPWKRLHEVHPQKLEKILQHDSRIVGRGRGELLVRSGDYGNSAFFVRRGHVRVVTDREGLRADEERRGPDAQARHVGGDPPALGQPRGAGGAIQAERAARVDREDRRRIRADRSARRAGGAQPPADGASRPGRGLRRDRGARAYAEDGDRFRRRGPNRAARGALAGTARPPPPVRRIQGVCGRAVSLARAAAPAPRDAALRPGRRYS